MSSQSRNVVNGDITVYAQWEYDAAIVRYTVTFDSDEAEISAKPDKVVVTGAGGNAMPATPPKKTGYNFDGWFTEKNGLGDAFDASYKVTGNITVYAMWTLVPENPVTITFDKNGGKYDASPREKKVTKGTAIAAIAENTAAVLPQEPYRENYNFKGWNTRADGSGAPFDKTTVVNGDITVYAQWEYDSTLVRYTVTFDSDGADKQATPALVIVTADRGNAMPVALPEKEGYIFGGWYTEKYGMGDAFDASYKVTGNIIVYAKWTLRNENSVSIAITFDPNSGIWGDGSNTQILIPVTPTSGIPIPAQNLTKAGYYFTGWNTKADGTGDAFGASSEIIEDTAVYAKWEALPPSAVYVTFDKNSGGDKAYDASPSVIAAAQGSTISALPQDPFREGYGFTRWDTRADGKSGSSFDGETTVDVDITVYAQWSYNPNFLKYTVTFDSDGADAGKDVSPRFVRVSANGGNTMPATLPEKTGKLFDGWYTERNGKGTSFGASFIVRDDMTVYASWIDRPAGELVTVTFNENGGTSKASPQELIIIKNNTIPPNKMPQDPAREGYFVKSWNLAADGTGTEFTGSYVVDTDITVYAQWGSSSYTVSFDIRGAASAPVNPQTIKHGNRVTKPADPQKDDFDFDGWYWDRAPLPDVKWDFTINVVTDNMTLYAGWKFKQPIPLNLIEAYLGEQKDLKEGQNEFKAVPLEVNFDLGDMTSVGSNWQTLLKEIGEKEIFVNLDLSQATLNAMPGKNEFDPAYSANDVNVQKGKSYITSLTLPAAAKTIKGGTKGYPNFEHFTSMSKVAGAGVTGIGAYTFCGIDQPPLSIYNYKLLEVDFPAAVTIGEAAFMLCINLKKADYPNADEIGAYAFAYCSKLVEYNFDTVTKIRARAFMYSGLPEAIFPKVTTVEDTAFGYCPLTTLRFPSLVEAGTSSFSSIVISVIDKDSFPALLTIGNHAFANCRTLVSINLPVLKTFGDYAFNSCYLLETVTIPKVETFGWRGFFNSQVIPLTCTMGSQAPTLGTEMFYSAYDKKTVTVKVPNGAAGYDSDWQTKFKAGSSSKITLNVVYQ